MKELKTSPAKTGSFHFPPPKQTDFNLVSLLCGSYLKAETSAYLNGFQKQVTLKGLEENGRERNCFVK